MNTANELRSACRAERHQGPTVGAAEGFVQVNLVVLPALYERDFSEYCRLNPKPCPLLEKSAAGEYEPKYLAPGADLRTDLPAYRVFRHGELVERTRNIKQHWEPNFVAFLIGCSFTFDSMLLDAGLPARHVEQNCNVPMYKTSLPTAEAGPFSGPLIVSMRPMTAEQADAATRITAEMESTHGAPIHRGDPERIGVQDLNQPDYGDAVDILPGEIPVFWACGVTPLEAIMRARPPIAITHEPGHMFVTDLPISRVRSHPNRST